MSYSTWHLKGKDYLSKDIRTFHRAQRIALAQANDVKSDVLILSGREALCTAVYFTDSSRLQLTTTGVMIDVHKDK